MVWWWPLRLTWTLLFVTWSTYLLHSGLYMSSTMALVSAVVEATSSTTDRVRVLLSPNLRTHVLHTLTQSAARLGCQLE